MMSMSTLYENASFPGKYIEESWSFPIPVREDGELRIVLLIYFTQFDPDVGLMVRPPRRIRVVDPSTGELVRTKEVTPQDFAQADAINATLGLEKLEKGVSPEQYLGGKSALLNAYDVLVPAFGRGDVALTTPEAQRAAYDFQRLFPVVVEKPLLPYYYAAGKEFFAWLDRVAPAGAAPPPDAGPPAVDLQPDPK